MSPASWTKASVFLKPGELAVSEKPTLVSTVLGSCVAVTLYNRRRRYGAICHAMLPNGDDENSFKYVDGAFDHMLGRFALAGIEHHEIEVNLFGGADVLPTSRTEKGPLSVGRQNIEAAQMLIKKEGLNLDAASTGGLLGCKIFFYTHTGEVLLKRIEKNLLK